MTPSSAGGSIGGPAPQSVASAPRPAAPSATGSSGPALPPGDLIRLDRPFDVDEFSRLLGETSIRLTVPPDALAEVLRRVLDFMGFGIYVYAIAVRPAPSELLKGYVVELQRVEYDPDASAWRPFVDRGTVPPSGDTGP